ncbi:hypothetical protein VP01_5178g1 [Puccinia sorghi]|uniref:Uncharacterized protein n=1 Tax=Puccinia sorghi TaxID=27349 RepID=A0A0L6UKT6_9BASI|nr:hypothetical protein VP01_5178g1 [Puccinia sorghi]
MIYIIKLNSPIGISSVYDQGKRKNFHASVMETALVIFGEAKFSNNLGTTINQYISKVDEKARMCLIYYWSQHQKLH